MGKTTPKIIENMLSQRLLENVNGKANAKVSGKADREAGYVILNVVDKVVGKIMGVFKHNIYIYAISKVNGNVMRTSVGKVMETVSETIPEKVTGR